MSKMRYVSVPLLHKLSTWVLSNFPVSAYLYHWYQGFLMIFSDWFLGEFGAFMISAWKSTICQSCSEMSSLRSESALMCRCSSISEKRVSYNTLPYCKVCIQYVFQWQQCVTCECSTTSGEKETDPESCYKVIWIIRNIWVSHLATTVKCISLPNLVTIDCPNYTVASGNFWSFKWNSESPSSQSFGNKLWNCSREIMFIFCSPLKYEWMNIKVKSNIYLFYPSETANLCLFILILAVHFCMFGW